MPSSGILIEVQRRRSRSGRAGYVLKVNEDKCTNCGACYDVCPYGVIREHPDRAVAYKCDLCDGTPQCVAFCQNPHVLAVEVRSSKAEKTPMPA